MIAIVTRVTWNVKTDLICISLIASEIELFSVSWQLAPDLLRTVLISMAHLLIWLGGFFFSSLSSLDILDTYKPQSAYIHLHSSIRLHM